MELPLTEPCPQCGADMEPQKTARRGRMIYECPECGYQMALSESPAGETAVRGRDADLDAEDAEENDEEDEEREDED